MKTLFLWDQAWTLVALPWDADVSGFPDYDAFARSVSDGLSDRDPFVYEQLYEYTFRNGWHRSAPMPGALQAIQLPGAHWTFSTGTPEQWEWILAGMHDRAAATLLQAAISQNRSTFEFAYQNTKTAAMYRALLTEAVELGFDSAVVFDDKPAYILAAAEAVKEAKLPIAVEVIWVATNPQRPEVGRQLPGISSLTEYVSRAGVAAHVE